MSETTLTRLPLLGAGSNYFRGVSGREGLDLLGILEGVLGKAGVVAT